MGNANARLHMGTVPLTTDWQLYSAPITCRGIQLTADKDWMYCSDKSNPETARMVGALQREMVVEFGLLILGAGEAVCWIKGTEAGTIWEKCLR
jgi:hypothetical protein